MKANAEKIENNTILLEVELEPERFSKALDQAYKKLVKKVVIPGFRRGKAPRPILERHVGKQTLVDEAVETILPEAYFKAVEDTGIEPITQPELELVQVEEGKPVVFKAKVVVKPEVELGQYTDLEVTKPKVDVTEEDIRRELENLQNRHAKLITQDEGQVEKGDFITIDYEGRVDGEPFEGGQGVGSTFEIGKGIFFPGVEDQLIGVAIGETKEITGKFPDDYIRKELAGKEVSFTVIVKGIKRKELSPLDDEFAKDISEYTTLEELKAEIKNRLEKIAKDRGQGELRVSLLEKVIKNTKIDMPKEMVDNKIREMLHETEQRLQAQGTNLNEYLKFLGISLDEIKEQFRPGAEKSVKASLVLEAIAKKENINPSEEELQAEMEAMSKKIGQDVEMVRRTIEAQGRMESLVKKIQTDKSFQFLIDKARILEDNSSEEIPAQES